DHAIVLLEYLSLKYSETFFGIVGPTHVEARFIVFKVRSARHDAVDRHLEGRAKEKRNIRLYRKAINFSYPGSIATTGDVASKGRVDIPVSKNDSSGFERRYDVA